MKALFFALLLALPSTQIGRTGIYTETVTLDATPQLCTESECLSQCREWVNNRFCMFINSRCETNNDCHCFVICALPGAKPHLAVSCEDREDSSHP